LAQQKSLISITRVIDLRDVDSLDHPPFTSLVAIARMVGTSAIIATFTYVIAVVGKVNVEATGKRTWWLVEKEKEQDI
jgi:hypothetical protein